MHNTGQRILGVFIYVLNAKGIDPALVNLHSSRPDDKVTRLVDRNMYGGISQIRLDITFKTI